MKTEIEYYLKNTIPEPRKSGPQTPLRFCESCKSVWQSYWGNQDGMLYTKLPDMPTYGLKRESCNECR